MGFEHGMSRRTLVTLAVCLLAMPELVGARPRAPAPPRGPARTGAARPSTPAPPSTDAPPRVAAKASLRYLGLGADHVGPSAQLGGDGEDDAREALATAGKYDEAIEQPRRQQKQRQTAGVSPAARARFWGLIRQIAGSGKTVFVTTHYMDEAEQCGRIALMNTGRLIALDAPDALKAVTAKK